MVGNVDRRGLRDWLAQRVTAVLIGAYVIFLLSYLVLHSGIGYQQWHALFNHVVMKMATVIVVLSILWHAWLGLWTVFTDYVKNKVVRLLLETAVILLLVAYLVWLVDILW